MDIYDVAIKMEVEGAIFYRDLASKASSDGLKSIFNMLAEDEDRHKETFEAMKAKKEVTIAADAAAAKATQIFKKLSKEDFLNEEDYLAVYEEALEIELKSIELYTQQLAKATDEKEIEAWKAIIEEERSHYDLIDDIIVMVERPERWVEQAEFGVREDY
jgi:rubrerythrin